MNTLSPIELPLNCTALIEASAGTGKTFTMANLYLRLLLGVGCQPLTVEQILVVTFTKAATEELRDRIRKNIKACRMFLQEYDADQSYDTNDFFFQLHQQIERVEEAILRLRIAEREIDLASIFTIDSFCQKMLFQFAFDSGVRFDSDLQPDESDLLRRISEEVWREMFYPMGLNETALIVQSLGTPKKALRNIQQFIDKELPAFSSEQSWIESDLAYYVRQANDFFYQAKQHWLNNGEQIIALVQAELAKTYAKGIKKSLSRLSYKSNLVAAWIKKINDWANSQEIGLPEAFERFCQDFMQSKAEEGAEPLSDQLFVKNQQIWTAYQTEFTSEKQKALLLYQYLSAVRQKLADYKATHSEKSFNDLRAFLNQALKSERGEVLAEQIRRLFPFAMIDEFQDTDKEQYEIFHKIFMQGERQNRGFIMIGDPKQSIYKFRGADIFTYLTASQQAQEKRTLPKNWRSLPEIVTSTNRLFTFPESVEHRPFLYDGIRFQAVEHKQTDTQLVGAEHFNCYLQEEFNEQEAAEHCAYQIQQQLKAMEAGDFGLNFAKDQTFTAFQAKDIAILVRGKKQAILLKDALATRGIRSVFLSDRRSVYASDIAQELKWVLYACLNPYHQSSVLTAIGSSLWGLSAAEIYRLKNDENAWDKQVTAFIHYQQIWQQQGILPMLHQLFMQEGIIHRLRAGTDSDRRLTDLLHLAELLQNAMPSLENESALVRWYERQLENPQEQEDQQLRLESEDELIKIITIHGSKGLQYPIVWLPFIGKNNRGDRPSQGEETPKISLYRDEQDQISWHLGKRDKTTQALMDKAEFAEDLRLLYVALTRAESQLNLILPTIFAEGWNPMHYLLSNGEVGVTTAFATEVSTQEYLDRKRIKYKAVELNSPASVDTWRPKASLPSELQARSFHREIARDGQISSFTALHAYHERNEQLSFGQNLLSEKVQDYDRQVDLVGLDEQDWLEDNTAYSAYQFPHSTKVGSVLHRFFEHCDFQQAVDFEQVFAICEQLGLDENWHTPLQQWLEKVLETPFSEAEFRLKDVPITKRLNEWQFYLRLKNADGLRKLNQLLQQYSTVSANLADLNLPQLEGYLRGFVDCIVQVNDKFYLIDYKSNFLGYLAQDYSQKNLQKAIGQYRYDLQYLLYMLAFHRYLRVRLGEQYDYDRDFGGVAYLFLRGMNGTANSGVFFEKPCKQLIDGMDEIFG
ncbi:exodeoxyribonuclease V subunit beta [Actinobacillus genomosp. 2]|uniref:exodeoxyribonuclease V subunit beta n=1 Tax=Actinobacillus genomosp. 2 TaxID=230709 RepID=UPI0024411976|nr:exodeoxyribonuclease V subunit beta [Actinobacillus genomosp. 2]WGE32681.1 exodeoxyribonuclease V subunit beta [Actinobacillus genomosp. 2]